MQCHKTGKMVGKFAQRQKKKKKKPQEGTKENSVDTMRCQRSAWLSISRCLLSFYQTLLNLSPRLLPANFFFFIRFNSRYLIQGLISLVLQIVHLLIGILLIPGGGNNGGSSSFDSFSLTVYSSRSLALLHTNTHTHTHACTLVPLLSDRAELYDYGLSLCDLCVCNLLTWFSLGWPEGVCVGRGGVGTYMNLSRKQQFAKSFRTSFLSSTRSGFYHQKPTSIYSFQDKCDTFEVILHFSRTLQCFLSLSLARSLFCGGRF